MATTIKSRPSSKTPEFVKAKPSKKKTTIKLQKAVSPSKAKNRKNGDEIWDELLATPESEAFLTLMIAEVRQEEAEGKLIEGGWSDAL